MLQQWDSNARPLDYDASTVPLRYGSAGRNGLNLSVSPCHMRLATSSFYRGVGTANFFGHATVLRDVVFA